jgi:hypothetical protein
MKKFKVSYTEKVYYVTTEVSALDKDDAEAKFIRMFDKGGIEVNDTEVQEINIEEVIEDVKTINKLEAYVKILNTKGQIFTASFIKKNGSYRDMNCRLGVVKERTGKGMSYKPLQRLLLPVFDMQKKEYRMINLNTVYYLVIGGIKYIVK